MSWWTSVHGIVTVEVPGNDQRVKDFIVGEVVDHLPRVTGSEGDMHIEIVRRDGFNGSSTGDGFGMASNLGRRGRWFDTQDCYDLVLDGALRDRRREQTLREFSAFMSRLASRLRIGNILVRVSNCYDWEHVFSDAAPWRRMYRPPFDYDGVCGARHWSDWRYCTMPSGDDVNWTEYLVNLVPGGGRLAEFKDFVSGNLEWYEYGQTPDEIMESRIRLRGIIERALETDEALESLWREMNDEEE